MIAMPIISEIVVAPETRDMDEFARIRNFTGKCGAVHPGEDDPWFVGRDDIFQSPAGHKVEYTAKWQVIDRQSSRAEARAAVRVVANDQMLVFANLSKSYGESFEK